MLSPDIARRACRAEEVVETRRAEPVTEIGGNGVVLLVDFKSERLHRSGGLTAASAWADNRGEAEGAVAQLGSLRHHEGYGPSGVV